MGGLSGYSSLFRGIYEEPERADEITDQTAHGFVRAGLGASTLGLSEVGFAIVEAVDSGDFTQLQDASLGMLTWNAAIKARVDPPNVHPRARPRRQVLGEPKSVARQGVEPCPKAKVVEEGRPPHEGGEFLDDSHVGTFDETRPPAVKRLSTVPSSGVDLVATPGKTTTVLGRFNPDLKPIIKEVMGDLKSWDIGAKPGDFNTLNIPRQCLSEVGGRCFLGDVQQAVLGRGHQTWRCDRSCDEANAKCAH